MSSTLRLHHLALSALLVAPLALLSACDGSSEGDDEHAEEHTHDESDTTDETGHASGCEAETRDDEFSVGLAKSGTSVTATFVSADPAPPIKGDNTWVLSFTDIGGAPLDNLTISATPTMPDHGHGTPVAAVVTPTGTAGEYEITPINLFMAGYWEVALDVTLEGGATDSVTFGFCVE